MKSGRLAAFVIASMTAAACGGTPAGSAPDDDATTWPDDAESAGEAGADTAGDQAAEPPGLPPSVAFIEPPVGTFLSDCTGRHPARVRVTADLPLDRVLLDGVPLEPRPGELDGSFAASTGLTLIDAEVRDDAGRTGREHRAVICGEFGAAGEPVQGAADLWLGRDALDAVGRLAARLFDEADLTAAFAGMGTLYESQFVRVTPGEVHRSQGTVVSLVPAWGRIMADVAVNDFEAWVRVEVIGGDEAWDVGVVSDRVAVAGEARLDLDAAGEVVAELAALEVDLGSVSLEVAGVGDVLDVFPDMREQVVELVSDQIEAWVLAYVPGAVSSALGHLDDPVPVDILDRAFVIRFRPSVVDVKPSGVRVALDVSVEGLEPDEAIVTPGPLKTPGEPEPPETGGVRLAVRDDLLNGVLHEVWRSGMLRLVVDQAFLDARKVEVTLVAGFLGGVLDRLPTLVDPETPIAIGIDARLPPVADADLPVSGGVRLGLGEVAIEVASAEDGAPLVSLAATVQVDGEVRPGGPGEVRLSFNALDVALDLVNPAATLRAAESYLEEGTADLLGSLGPLLGGLIGTLPLPSLGGFTVGNAAVGTLPGAGGTLVISGELVER